jgi:transposase
VFVCVLALVIERVMRLRLKQAKSTFSPAKALDELRKLTHVQFSFGAKQHSRQILANKAPAQLDIFDALNAERFTDVRLKKLTA